MAIRTFGIKDAKLLMQGMARQATGQQDLTVTTFEEFIDAGQKVLDQGPGAMLTSISVLCGKTIFNEKVYTGKFRLAYKTVDAFNARLRKISFYNTDPDNASAYNTDLYTNLGDGLDDTSGTGSQWEQRLMECVEEFWYSDDAWMKWYTTYEDQIALAFTSEAEYIKFINGFLIAFNNDVELMLESKNRALILDRIAGNYHYRKVRPESAINFTSYYNKKCGTRYSTKEILRNHREDFLKFFPTKFQIESDRMTNLTKLYHDSMTKTKNGVEIDVLRHTPKSAQKFIYFKPLMTESKAMVYPSIFNPQYIAETNGEGIEFWQSFTDPMKIAVRPALPDGETSEDVKIPYVIGLLFDEDAILGNNLFQKTRVTEVNARKCYFNTFMHYLWRAYQAYDENSILFYMEDEETEEFAGDGSETTFNIAEKPVSVRIFVNDVEVEDDAFTYDAETGDIVFETAPENGAEIEVYFDK